MAVQESGMLLDLFGALVFQGLESQQVKASVLVQVVALVLVVAEVLALVSALGLGFLVVQLMA